MTVLLLIKRFDFGGAENHVRDLANNLSKRGHNVILVGVKGRQEKELLPEVKYIKLKLRDVLLPIHIAVISFLILYYKVNVIHSHQRLAILIGCLAGFLTCRRVISTVHGRSKYDLKHIMSRRLTNKIIFVSKTVLKQASKRYNLNQKAVFIPNGVKTSQIRVSPKPYRICYVSKINSKHFDFLKLLMTSVLTVLKQKYPDLEFWVVGDGKKANELRELADSLNSKFSSIFCTVIGYKPSVQSYYQDASLVIGVGRAAIEASAAGLPVLSANHNRVGGIVTTENYETFKYNNFIDVSASAPSTDKLKNNIEEFFSYQSEWQKESRLLANQIQKDFSLDKIVEKTVSLY